jgi:hypothetical protein
VGINEKKGLKDMYEGSITSVKRMYGVAKYFNVGVGVLFVFCGNG